MATHQQQVHLKIKTKRCHVCNKRFFSKQNLRSHMLSHHQTNDHDMAKCDNCVIYLKKSHRLSQARTASHKRRAGNEGTHPSIANAEDIESKEEVEDKEENSIASNEMGVKNEMNDLNDDLIDIHMDMQLLSYL